MTSPTVKRRRLATTLRELREQTGLTLEEVAERVGLARSTLSRIENARAAARPPVVRGLLPIYHVHDTAAEVIVQLAKDASRRGWWHSYRDVIPDWFETFVGFESEAALIQTYEPQVVPGLLQTEAYARALLGPAWLNLPNEQVDRRLAVRLGRQRVLANEPRVAYDVVLSEAVLRCRVGSGEILRDQLLRLVEAVDRQQASIQVLPFEAGPVASSYGAFVLLDFPEPEDPPIGYVEHLTGAELLDDTAELEQYKLAFRHQRTAALSVDDSVHLIATAATDGRR